MNLLSTLATAALVTGTSSLSASTATYSLTDGNGNNRPFVDGGEATDAGLVAEDAKGGGPTSGALDNGGNRKGVDFGLLGNSGNSIVDMYFSTDVLSEADTGPGFASPMTFTGEGHTSYSMIVEGAAGPNKNTAALYDLKIEGISPVPLPASAILLGTAFAAFGVAARRHRRRS